MSIPVNSIRKDDKGFYAWTAENRKFLMPAKGLNPIFNVRKAYVVPGELRKFTGLELEMNSLKDPGILELNDLVLTEVPKKLKNGDRVELVQQRYRFMPGDSVKVVIGNQ